MYRIQTLLVVLVSLVSVSLATAQLQNPAGFLDPAGANRAGTAAPPNTSIGPIGGSTLPPGAPSGGYSTFSSREVETNPALRQEVRRPFGGGGYRFRAVPPPDGTSPGATGDPNAAANVRRADKPVVTDPGSNTGGAATGKLSRDWRYVYSQGRHWYWMPNNTWDVWTGSGWVPYKRGMFSQPTFGYGTQVRGYRAIPADSQIGTPAGAPDESAATPLEEGNAVARANRVTGTERTYAPQEITVPASSSGGFSGTRSGNSSSGPAMPNEHFISP